MPRLRVGHARNDREHFHCIDAIGCDGGYFGAGRSDRCVTPCAVQAKRNADITVSISKEGYQPQVIPLTKEIPGAGAAGFAGNILAGGLVGMGVDAATGAALDRRPNPVIVTLQPSRPVSPPRAAKPRAHPPAKPQPQS